MYANLFAKRIEMTKAEAKAAGKYGSDKFNELKNYQTAYPTFDICIKVSPRRKTEFKGLTYDYMRSYIQKTTREDKASIEEEFNDLIAKDKKDGKEGSENFEAASYVDVKKWFLVTFPEIREQKENHEAKVREIMSKVA